MALCVKTSSTRERLPLLRVKSSMDFLRSFLGQKNLPTAKELIVVVQRWKSSCEVQLSSSRTNDSKLSADCCGLAIDGEVRLSLVSLECTVSVLTESIADLLSDWTVTSLKEAAYRSGRSTATLTAAASAWKTQQQSGSLQLKLVEIVHVQFWATRKEATSALLQPAYSSQVNTEETSNRRMFYGIEVLL